MERLSKTTKPIISWNFTIHRQLPKLKGSQLVKKFNSCHHVYKIAPPGSGPAPEE
jgi:hypothetical protein